MRMVGLVLALLASLILSGCSTYNTKFACGDARGANCMSMDRVDRMISNGQIEEYTQQKQKCRGRKCKAQRNSNIFGEEELQTRQSLSKDVTYYEKN